MLVGVTDKKGADMTVSVTPTVKEPNPILKMTDAVYVPAARCAFRFEAVMVTLAVAPAFKVLLVGLVKSQFAPLLVCAVADQVPGELQFVNCHCLCWGIVYIGSTCKPERVRCTMNTACLHYKGYRQRFCHAARLAAKGHGNRVASGLEI